MVLGIVPRERTSKVGAAGPAVARSSESGARSKVSLVVPVYDEQGAIEPFVTAIELAIGSLEIDFDILFVDDGSRDSTCEEIWEIARSCTVPIRLHRPLQELRQGSGAYGWARRSDRGRSYPNRCRSARSS